MFNLSKFDDLDRQQAMVHDMVFSSYMFELKKFLNECFTSEEDMNGDKTKLTLKIQSTSIYPVCHFPKHPRNHLYESLEAVNLKMLYGPYTNTELMKMA